MEDLRQEVEQLKQEIKELREALKVANETIKSLQAQLNQNSSNSNWPSSRDKSRAKPKSLRKKSGRKAGGQKGHKGHTLEYNPNPDVVEVHRPVTCQKCQSNLPIDSQAIDVSKRQVIDLPSLHFVTIEHQVETVACPCCGMITEGDFPEEVTHPVQYGNQVKQLAVYLRHEQFIPYERGRQLLADLFELPISTGTLHAFVEKASEQVAPVMELVKDAIIESEVVHADETGFYVNGKRFWLHTASTEELTYYEPHPNRGHKALDAIGIVPELKGTLVHDAWPTYFRYQLLQHALCNAHHLRDLTAIIENEQQYWAKLMIACLLSAKEVVDLAFENGEMALSEATIARIQQVYEAVVAFGMAENPLPEHPPPKKRGRPKKTKSRNLVERFDKHQDDILRFIHDFKVPFDNNLAERDIRMMKVQQKISGCFRTLQGAQQFCRLRSYISTIRKQGLSVWLALGSLFSGDVLIPNLTPE